MNKTVTINISGIIFHIEEDAFDKLSKYMSTIKGYFSKTEGGNEIMSDIESRIAEMLQGKVGPIKQVVLLADVDDVIASMGRPEEFAGEEETTTSSHQKTSVNEEPYDAGAETVKKRLYRDPDNKMLGGVCAGIGNYFDFDPTWLRILLAIVAFFSFGSLILVYIILWIVIPEARTTAEKLAMRGEKIDINTISKTVKEEAEQLKKRMEKYGDDIRNYNYEKPKDGFDRFLGFVKDIFSWIFRFMSRFVGLALLILGIFFFFIFVSSIFGVSVINDVNGKEWVNFIMTGEDDFTIGLIGAILFFGIPIVVMIYGGIKLLFKIRYSNRWLNITAGGIWTLGLILVIYVGARIGRDFSESAKIKETFEVAQTDTLRLELNAHPHSNDEYDVDEDRHYGRHRGHIRTHIDSTLIFKDARLSIVPSPTDSFQLFVIKRAKGGNKYSALSNARMIRYKLEQKANALIFDEAFTMSIKDKWRDQEVQVLLKVPKGKTIYLDKKLKYFIFDVENVTDTYDHNMVGHHWKMTEEGLKCSDCHSDKGEDADEIKHITISSSGSGTITTTSTQKGNAKVKIDENGINVTSDEAKVKITKDGIHVETTE